MATLFERLTGFGDGANEPIDLDVFFNALHLQGQEIITMSAARQMAGLTAEQGDEFDFLIFNRQPSSVWPDRIVWIAHFRALIFGARAALPALDSVENVKAALGYEPGT